MVNLHGISSRDWKKSNDMKCECAGQLRIQPHFVLILMI
ncbi:hypothetical protein SS1G_01547 [Sclerotinia sclerotiorum 1980 UF-70]|uniref:Uncharacterized protein n=1 Tax=Sclerotinia sclerotiorum (strain ATCC 18683 / 1980 / Ss-1) TaxID=665079 RepID=A7E8B9_SCLS1|nr:hypothetical protein SS1G_01547 [Sclerotinia sclerotiorum 1980 UF-70]EDN96621.1 hypothetical protein SS1G_01547 [Sclerotinia sclerotiorum 1980 UF-70]